MAKITYISIPPGLDQKYNSALRVGDRFFFPHIAIKRTTISRPRKARLKKISPFITLAPVWQDFSVAIKLAWTNAGASSSMSGFKQFIQDTSARIKAGLSGYHTPSTLYQSKVGMIHLVAPAVGFTIAQLHPQSYYINKKVTGTRSEFAPKLVVENFNLPVNITISYKSDLVAVGGSPFARFFVRIFSNYQGRTIETDLVIPFSLLHGWERLTASLSSVLGQVRGYTAFVQIGDARGTLLFDNVSIIHNGLNWARDPFCNSIQTTFTKAFYQIPKNWAAASVISGATYRSVYHE